MAQLVIFGAGDIARLARFYFESDSPHRVAAFAVDEEFRTGESFQGLPLISFEGVSERYPPDDFQFFVALSYARMNRLRAEKCAAAEAMGYRLQTYVSSRATYLSQWPPGKNCFILEDNTVQPFVSIGNDVTLWSGNHIGHDSTVEDHCFISSQVVVSGNCRVGAYSFLGVNATLRDSVRVAPRTIVGAGAAIMGDTVANGVYLAPRTTLSRRTSDEVEL